VARIIDTSTLTPDSRLDRFTDEAVYNGLDCCVTLEVLEALQSQLTNTTASTYDFSMSLCAPILEMNLHGVRVDREEVSKSIASYQGDINHIRTNLDYILKEGVGYIKPWTGLGGMDSRFALQEIFYDILQLPPVRKRNAEGKYVPTVDRKALEKLKTYTFAEPIVNHVLAMRDIGKKISFLNTSIDPDGRLRTQFNIAGTRTGRLASALSAFGTGCVKPTAEALTKAGWKRLCDILPTDQIAQWDEGIISFVDTVVIWFNFEGELVKYKSEQVSLTVTPDHRMIAKKFTTPYRTKSAIEYFGQTQLYVPLGGTKLDGTLTVPLYLPMLMADFSVEGTIWRGQFTKKRKIDRFLELMARHQVEFKEGVARPDYRRFSIKYDRTVPTKWGPWVLDLTPECAEQLVEETKYWDAHVRGNSFIFYTVDEEQAIWFQILCHLTGRSTTKRSQRNSDEAYGHNSIIFSVNVKPKAIAQVMPGHWSREKYEGEVGCPQVPSSYWLVREDGFISVTGNSNLQNVERRLRRIFIPDPGYKFCNIDLEQADARNMGAILYVLFGDRSYLDACNSGDLHTTVCKMVWPNLPWTGYKKEDRKIADEPFYRDMSRRDMTKRLGHGSNYLGTAPTMSINTKIPLELVKNFQSLYFERFPNILKWHDHVRYQLKHEHSITTLLGRRRNFFGRPDDESVIREAVAFEPQSMTADEIDQVLLALWRSNTVECLLQVHDSILFQYKQELEQELIPNILSNPYTFRVRDIDFFVPMEAKIGWNWADVEYNKDGTISGNPNGLVKYRTEGDTRNMDR
jgi:DNA polymerase I-like protein with 3'-5' exonuclease and polymerase domains